MRETLMGVQMRMRRRSVEARLARKVLVGDLKEFFCITVKMMSRFPSTPSANITLIRSENIPLKCTGAVFNRNLLLF